MSRQTTAAETCGRLMSRTFVVLLIAYAGNTCGLMIYHRSDWSSVDLSTFASPMLLLATLRFAPIVSIPAMIALLGAGVISVVFVCDSSLPRVFLVAVGVCLAAASSLTLLAFRTG